MYISFVLDFSHNIFVDLSIAKLPEGHRQHDKGDPLDDVKCQQGHFLIEGWWFSIVIGDKELFVDEENNEGHTCYTVEWWHRAPVGESDADLEENRRVPVMNEVLGARVEIYIGLYRRLRRNERIRAKLPIHAPHEVQI